MNINKWLFTIIVLLQVINNRANVKTCLEYILETVQPQWISQIVTNFETGLKYPVIIVNNLKELQKNVRLDVAIINSSLLSVEDFLTWNHQNEYFNSKTTYIFLSQNISRKPFQILAKYFLKSAFVVDGNLSIYSYHPYRYENVDDPDTTPVKVGECHSPSIKIPKNSKVLWRNTTIKVGYRIVEPYTMENGDGLENKFLIQAQQILETKLTGIKLYNYEHEPVNLIRDEYISKQGIDMLKKGEADLLIGYNSPTDLTFKHFDVSEMSYYDTLIWVYPNAQKTSHWKRIFHIFSGELWFFLLFVIIIWTSLVYYIETGISLYKLLFVVYQVLFENAVSKSLFKNRKVLKLLFSAWIIAFLIISTMFKNSLLIILGTGKKLPEFLTLQDLLTLNFKIASHVDLSTFYIDNITPITDIYQVENCSSVLVCVNRTAFQQNSITTAPRSILWYNWIPKYFITDYGEVLIKASSTKILTININIIFRKGYPLYEPINDILVRFREQGWFSYVFMEMRIKVKRATNHLVFEVEKLGMDKFGFVFVLWATGLNVAALAFVCEVALHRTLSTFISWCK